MENMGAIYGAAVWNASNGAIQWGVHTGADTCRGMAADIDPRYPGEEVWASTGVGLYQINGTNITSTVPSINFGIWWDGDLSRELLDDNHIDKWNYTSSTTTNLLTAMGDWTSLGKM